MIKSSFEKYSITPELVESITATVRKVPWPLRRKSMAEITLKLLNGKPRTAEIVFGWNRATVNLGLNELQSGLICHNDLSNRRRLKTEEKYPKLIEDIRALMETECHADPQLRTTLAYTDKTAFAVCKALIENGWAQEIIPCVRTMSNILLRLGYRIRTVAKTKVQKKTPGQTKSLKTSTK
jgi:hypothetical protein